MQANRDTKGAEETFTETNRKYGIQIVARKLQPQEVRLAHRAVHILGQRYRFHGTPFQEIFVNKETNKMTTKLLPKLRMNRHHPIALRHAPMSRGGLQLPHLYVIQGTMQLKQAIKHIRLNSSLGKLLEIHLRWTQLTAGIQTGILMDTQTNLPHVPDNWGMKARQFLQHIQGSLQMDEQYVVSPLQEQDQCIMDLAISQGWEPSQLKQINACRLYLQIQYLSEITTDRHILPKATQEKQDRQETTSTRLQWPQQAQPGQTAWRLWKRMLRRLCRDDGITLRQPLTNIWTPIHRQYRTWKYVHDTQTNILYDSENNTQYTLRFSTRRKWYYHKQSVTTEISRDATPVTPISVGTDEKILHPSQFGKLRMESTTKKTRSRHPNKIRSK